VNQDLLQYLMQLTEEEKEIIEERRKVSKERYTSKAHFIIESENFLNKDKMIMVRKHTRFVDFPLHRHDYIEINYVFNGELKQKVGGREIHLKRGELLLLNQHIDHEIKASTSDDIIINFIIRPAFFELILSYLSSGNVVSDFLINSLYNHTQNGQFLYFKVAEVQPIQELIGKILDEIINPSSFSESTIKLYMGLFMIELIKNADKVEKSQESSLKHFLVVEILKYIEEHYKEASLTELATQSNQPHYALSKIIKKATGHTFKDLLQERRLLKAKELLEGTDLSVIAIVEEVGYDNISYFYRIFKGKYGQTPKEFRESTKG
jgi:AraC-like DNA-binding protein/mannose-6-phosphate isomerase-like protein (cupin superfamily)